MSSNEMGQGKKPSIQRNGNQIGQIIERSSVHNSYMNHSSISSNRITESMSDSTAPTLYQRYREPVHILQSLIIPSRKDRPNINHANRATSSFPPGTSLLKPLKPLPEPQIPTQFQKSNALYAMKITSIHTTPSGIDSATVKHANRSLVYPQAVSTKDTAPTKNTIEIKTSDTDCSIRLNAICSSTITNYSSVETSQFKVPSTPNLLKPITKSNFGESVSGTSFNSPHTNQTHLDSIIIDAPIASQDKDIYGNFQRSVSTKLLYKVNTKCHIFILYFFVLVGFIGEIYCQHVKFGN